MTRIPHVDGLFPLLIAVLVPVRIYVLPAIFGKAHVDAMDADGDPADAPSAAAAAAASSTRVAPAPEQLAPA